MAAPTKTSSTGYAVATGSTREDLSDAISMISPVDTPFMSAIGKGSCSNITPNWLVEELRAAAANTNTEGADASYAEEAGPARLSNVCQILDETLSISGTLEATTLAGRKSEIKYQLGLKMKEIARDSEYALLNGVYSASEPRQMRGVVDWLNDSTYYGTGTYYAFGGAYAVTNALTEDLFNDAIQAAWAEGGDVDMVIASPAVKRTISGFNATNKVTVNADQSDKRVIATVDYYESDFGTVKVVPERFFAADEDSGNAYDKCLFVQKSLWEKSFLRPFKTKKMADLGDAERYQIIGELTLKAKAPKGNALIDKIYRAA